MPHKIQKTSPLLSHFECNVIIIYKTQQLESYLHFLRSINRREYKLSTLKCLLQAAEACFYCSCPGTPESLWPSDEAA